MTEEDLTDEQGDALDALIQAAVDIGMSTNEHAHRAAGCRLKDRIIDFLGLLQPQSAPRSLSQAINATYDGS